MHVNVDLNVHYPCTSPSNLIGTHTVMILLYCPWSLSHHYGDHQETTCMYTDRQLVRGNYKELYSLPRCSLDCHH